MSSETKSAPAAEPTFGISIRMWILLFALCGLLASLLYDALFDDFAMAAFLCAGLAISVFARIRNQDDESSWFLTCLRGLYLGFVLLLCSMFA